MNARGEGFTSQGGEADEGRDDWELHLIGSDWPCHAQ